MLEQRILIIVARPQSCYHQGEEHRNEVADDKDRHPMLGRETLLEIIKQTDNHNTLYTGSV